MNQNKLKDHILSLLARPDHLLADRDAAFREFATWSGRFDKLGLPELLQLCNEKFKDKQFELLLIFLGYAIEFSGGLCPVQFSQFFEAPIGKHFSKAVQNERFRCFANSVSRFFDESIQRSAILYQEYERTDQSPDMNSRLESAIDCIRVMDLTHQYLNNKKIVIPKETIDLLVSYPIERCPNLWDIWGRRLPFLMAYPLARIYKLLVQQLFLFEYTCSYYLPRIGNRSLSLHIHLKFDIRDTVLTITQATPEMLVNI